MTPCNLLYVDVTLKDRRQNRMAEYFIRLNQAFASNVKVCKKRIHHECDVQNVRIEIWPAFH